MRECENCGANLDSGERCDCESDREKLDRACWMIAEAISTMRMADGLLRECGIKSCGVLDYNHDIADKWGRHIQLLSGKEAFERITGEKWKDEPVGDGLIRALDGHIRASTVYRGLKVIELQREGKKQ